MALLCVSAALGFVDSFEQVAARASAAREANDVKTAASLYRQALDLKPDWAEGWFFLGSLSYDADQYTTCQEAFTHLLAIDKNVPAGWALLGLCEFENGRYDQSLEHLHRAEQVTSGLPPEMLPAIAFHHAQLLTRKGLFDQAMAAYIALVQQGSHSEPVLNGIGLAALRTTRLVKEIPAAQMNVYGSAGAAVYLWVAGQTEMADKAFRGFVSRFDSEPNVHRLYGTYLLNSHPDQAMMEFKRELEVDPKNAEDRALIARQLLQDDQANEAMGFARRAVVDGPAVPLAQYVYGLLLTQRGELARGLTFLERAEQLDPQNLDYHLALGDAYSKAGRPEQARRERDLAVVIAKGSS